MQRTRARRRPLPHRLLAVGGAAVLACSLGSAAAAAVSLPATPPVTVAAVLVTPAPAAPATVPPTEAGTTAAVPEAEGTAGRGPVAPAASSASAPWTRSPDLLAALLLAVLACVPASVTYLWGRVDDLRSARD